ncbi:chromatin remodeling complex SWI/SNF component SWI2 [Myriangium duriaei CBS 260.36]|uniref:Chromatin remodeling complex SWI/SNF component SWI2 n=1 Tax=Myriangium duriaei CBS 260.36 TaxID=1168546 RepID=A0A9P4MT80_9PEZI|nr:chromatin remodeling complex SWI/SNF component SWI2 [Myriangium duriaei CBS 260.36]
MASVQPPAQQPGAAPGNPPMLTKEYLTATYQRYNQLKAQGAPETDPEMMRCRKILTVFKQRSEAAARSKVMKQQHDVSQQNGVPQQPLPNGSPTTNNMPAPPQTANGANSNKSGAAVSVASPNATPEHILSRDQAALLRNQIKAFNMLQRNMPIPQDMQEQLFATKKAANVTEALRSANQVLEEQANKTNGATKVEANGAPTEAKVEQKYLYLQDPHSLYLDKIPYLRHRVRSERAQLPTIMPLGIDPEVAREERARVVYNRLMARKEELAALPANLGSWDTSKSNTPTDDGKMKLKALIEYKMLSLLPKQRALREAIGREVMQADTLAMTANRVAYRRMKKQTAREARMTEKFEREQRHEHESKKKKHENDLLRSIQLHSEALKTAAAERRQRIQRLGKLMQTTHNTIEKDEQKRIERTAKQRLQALKANDEETYLKLLGQAKDSRISHLLKQTDGFLRQLSSSVKEQQRSAHNRYSEPEEDEPSDVDDDGSDDDDGGKKVDYYEVAHRIKEEVKAQSSNLVGGTLKEYQIKGLQWMISLYNNNLNGILADEMGLGKTIQTISLITYLIEKKHQPGPYLVIVPLSTLTNWTNEFEKWAPSVKKIVYKGPPTSRKAAQQQIRYGDFQVLLTTYEFIIKDRPVLAKVKWLHMIVDEGHRMKNAQSKLSSTITTYYNTRFRLILTGTPLQNNLPELWAILNFALPTIFKSVKSFDEWFNTPFANTGGQDKMELTEEEQLLVIRRLHKVLRPFLLRRLKKDVEKDLPDKQERVVKCNFSALQAKLYKQLVTSNRLTVSDGKGGKTSMRGLSNMLMQLRKLCNHPFVFEEVEDQINPGRGTNDLLWRTAGKFELLDRVLPKFQATGHRVLMFFQMTQIMNIMEDFMRLRGIQYLRLDGSTKADDRSELLKLFNAPNSPYFCFLLSTRAGGLGLNLQTADTVIIYDSDWNPHQDLQAQDRAHRIGQKNEVRILRLISSNSVEEKILERANFKLDMDGKVIQAGKFDNKSTNEERDEMLRVMLESAEAAEAFEQDEMDDDDLNMIMMRSDAELELFQKMDADRAKNSKYGPDKKLPRLFSEEELPDIYLQEDNPVVEEVVEIAGRGARERTKVKYDDGLTEEQWLDAVDADDDTIEDAIARKEQRIAKRATNKEKRARGEESPALSRESSEEPQPQPKKRGRKPKVEKRKAEEMEPEVAPPKKRGRQAKVVETLSPEQRNMLQSILDAVHDSLNELEEPSTDPDLPNRGIIDPFIELPPKNDYPDYYQLIKQPICMEQIGKKINKKQYQSLREFRSDIQLLCNNCRQYNEDGSVLFQDANLIEETCLRKLREEADKYPDYTDADEAASSFGDGASTRPMSMAGTPQPKMTLKLGKKSMATPGPGSSRGTDSIAPSEDD